jgi:Family of unknown function (DUF5994)
VGGQAHVVLGETYTGRFPAGDGSPGMTSAPHLPITPVATAVTERPRHPQRLRLRPKAPTTGHVDGAWWPRSRDIAAELPALLATLAVRLGDVLRVSYNLTEWDSAPRRIISGGRQIRLDGFISRPAHTVDVLAADKRRLTLLVVPSHTDAAAAHKTMMLAADRDNSQTVDDLLAAGVSVATQTERIPEQKARCT